jgi:hypothetical protein
VRGFDPRWDASEETGRAFHRGGDSWGPPLELPPALTDSSPVVGGPDIAGPMLAVFTLTAYAGPLGEPVSSSGLASPSLAGVNLPAMAALRPGTVLSGLCESLHSRLRGEPPWRALPLALPSSCTARSSVGHLAQSAPGCSLLHPGPRGGPKPIASSLL